MRVLFGLLGVLMVAAACSSGAGAGPPDPECEVGDLDCALLTVPDLERVIGEGVVVAPQEITVLEAVPAWCDRPLPDALESARSLHLVTSTESGVGVAVAVSAQRFDGLDSELMVDAVSGLRQGCEWNEGEVRFQYLDELDVGDFGDDALAGLFRTSVDGVSDNAELLWVRRGEFVVQIGISPAQDSPVLWDALLRHADVRLAQVAAE